MADYDSDVVLAESQRFVPQEDDDETLWEVVEITGERAKQYKVKWKGVDPKTNKPWEQSWVPKHDCTDDLVMEWKKKKQRKSASGASKRASNASGSKSTRRSTSTVAPNPHKKNTRSSVAKGSSRKNKIAEESEDEVEVKKPVKRPTRSNAANLPSESEEEPEPIPPKKKQKTKQAARQEVVVDSSENEEQERHVTKPKSSGQSKPKGKKRKHDEATSAHNSAKNISGGDPTNDERKPRKKRKIVVEVVKQEPESEELMEPEADEDEADEELVGRELSQLDIEQEEVEEEQPPKSPKKRKTFTAQSRSTSSVPPPESERRMPTEERSVFWDGDEAEHEPVLSPNAHLQLEEFDHIMGLSESPPSPASAANSRRKSRAAEEQPVASSSKIPVVEPLFRRSPSEHANDYDENEIVPETEGSQTQEPELQIVTQPAPSNKSIAPAARGVSTEKGKEGQKSKPLRPIPKLSPSAFHPHLPKPPQSSLPESITNASDDSRHLKSTSQRRPGSPIEQFDSPAREAPLPARSSVDRKGKGKMVVVEPAHPQKETASDIWDSEVVQRGQQLAEAAKRRRITESRSISPIVRPRKTVEEIIAHVRSSRSATGSESEQQAEAAQSDSDSDSDEAEPEGDGRYHPDIPGTSTLAVPPASEPHLLTLPDGFELGQDQDQEFDESLTLEQMEFAYVDLSGGVADPQVETQTQTQEDNSMDIDGPPLPADPTMLRQEEEESTQNVMLPTNPTMLRQEEEESTQDIRMQFQITRPSPPPRMPPVMEEDSPLVAITRVSEGSSAANGSNGLADDSDESDSSQQLQVPQITIHPASRAASVLSYADEEETQPPARNTRSRSRSQTPAIPSRSKALEKYRKGSAPPSRYGSVAPALPPVMESTELADTKALIATLQAELASAREKNTSLEASIATLRPQVISLNKSLIDKHEWATREIAEAESTWSTQKDELEAALLEAEKGKAEADAKRLDAEKDRDFFRAQYAQASGFVSQVRDENKDLLQRIEIAEAQTEKGVALVRATFDARVKVLEADVMSWRRMAEFLLEKDKKSNNAEICRAAAEAPELRARCEQQAATIAAYVEGLNEAEARADESTAELERYKDQVVHLNAELDDLAQRLELAGVIDASQDTSGAGSSDMVYRCDYRPGDQRRQCQEVFSTLQELQQHVVGPHGHIRT